MGKKTKEGVPALQNDDVTGMTEEKQDEVIRKSGQGAAAGGCGGVLRGGR